MLKNVLIKLAYKFKKYFQVDPMEIPLTGDRCIEYAYIIRHLTKLNQEYQSVLDVGCFASPLTSIISEMNFKVDGIDLNQKLPYKGNVNYISGDFISFKFPSNYDICVMCSTIEHIGLEGRFNSPNYISGDINAILKTKEILVDEGILILTIPYGKEKLIHPLHRVYNKEGKLFKEINNYFEVIDEEYYKNNSENVFVKCEETEAKEVEPSENNYALGLFCLKRKT
ncbi:MAG: class I SAM-dependent methyltransferase [Methanobacterium sp.]|uniref:class I SAM-dependent methyltransferase n=1 Tax=Methanobacterium sp. TaxID=2164 RepID=UPI003D64C8A2|nr:class I SAM-dependent methyltransferase [Methanobacterium sp.]